MNAQERYRKKNLITTVVRLNRATNKELIKKLEKVANKQGYIKELIENDTCIYKKYKK